MSRFTSIITAVAFALGCLTSTAAAAKQVGKDADKVEVNVVAEGDNVQLGLVGNNGESQQCTTPCTAQVPTGKLSLFPPLRTDPAVVTINGPSTLTFVPSSKPKLIGGAALVIAGATLLAILTIGGSSGKIGVIPALAIGAAGGAALAGGGTLYANSDGGVNVKPRNEAPPAVPSSAVAAPPAEAQPPAAASAHVSSLPMAASGSVSKASNPFGMRGRWYWYGDGSNGGRTQVNGVTKDRAPFDTARGAMCLQGTSPGGKDDNYLTWGVGIGLTLNQVGAAPAKRLRDAPTCYRITIAGTHVADGLRAQLVGEMERVKTEWPGKPLVVGVNDVCVRDVGQPEWCKTTPGVTCLDASALKGGIAAVQVQISTGAAGGPIDFCVTRLEPHD